MRGTERQETDWRDFADALTALAQTEGQSRFLDQAFTFLNGFVRVDSCSVFKVAADKTTGAQHLTTFGRLDSDLAELLARDYVANGFRRDPMVRTALTSANIRVRRLASSQYSSAYRSKYFNKAGLVDKVTSIHTSRNVLFLVSFYRLKESGEFSSEDYVDLERLAPIIGRFVLRHVRLNKQSGFDEDALAQRIDTLLDDRTQVFSCLSERERQVCRGLLLGDREDHIAATFGIARNTVVTHRRRIYGKLSIASRTELLQLAFLVV